MKCRVEHEKRNFISTGNHILFCLSYKHNSPLLTRKVYFSMIENKKIGNPRIKIVKCVGAVKTKTCVEALQKQTMGLIFKIKILSYELVLADRRNLSGTWPKSVCGISSGCRFSLSEIHHESHWIRNFRFFFSYFGFLPLLGKFKRHCL